MNEEAISLIKNQIDTYKVQIKNIANTLDAKNRTVINSIILKLNKEIEIRQYILNKLKEE
jgi:hypothetical protein